MLLKNVVKKNITTFKDFPKKGILFQDVFSITKNPKLMTLITNSIVSYIKQNKITKVVGIDSRGFIFGSCAALKAKLPFVPARKAGKLPGKVYKQKYKLEYGYDQIEIQSQSITKNDKVLVVDDLVATGGTALATIKLLKNTNKKKIYCYFVVGLKCLDGIKKISQENIGIKILYEADK